MSACDHSCHREANGHAPVPTDRLASVSGGRILIAEDATLLWEHGATVPAAHAVKRLAAAGPRGGNGHDCSARRRKADAVVAGADQGPVAGLVGCLARLDARCLRLH